jgi:hypothetical protein
MPREDFTDEELRALLALVSREIDSDRFPFSARVRKLRKLRRTLRRALGEPDDEQE